MNSSCNSIWNTPFVFIVNIKKSQSYQLNATWAYMENGPHEQTHYGGHVAAEAGRVNAARIERDGQHAGARQPLAQLEHEQDVRQLTQEQRAHPRVRARLPQLRTRGNPVKFPVKWNEN